MFNWLKKKELLTIANLHDSIAFYEGKLNELIKIANSKRVILCRNKKCMDYEDGTCTLDKVIIKEDGRCEDAFDPNDMREDIKEESKGIPPKVKITWK